jgi:PEP-CTERM motif
MKFTVVLAVVAILGTSSIIQASIDLNDQMEVVVDFQTGIGTLRATTVDPVELTSYEITSATPGSLLPGTWSSLQDQSISGWSEIFAQTTDLAEFNASTFLSVNTAGISIGKIYDNSKPSNLQYIYGEVGEDSIAPVNVNFVNVPEPSALGGLGLLSLLRRRRAV